MSNESVPIEPVPVPSEAPLSRHLLPASSSISDDGRLSIGGLDLCDLTEEYGTPLFVYDEDHLRARCREAVAAFGTGVAYATKAFLCKAMARLAVEEGMFLDVSTAGEFLVAIRAGVTGSRLVFHGNNKSGEELELAIEHGVHRLVLDSFDEIARLARIVGRKGLSAPLQVLLRLNPGIEAHTHHYVMTGQEDSKFGFSLANGAAAHAIEDVRAITDVELVGIHAHLGSQIFRLESFEREVGVLAPFFEKHGLGELCVGGGLGVAYLNDEKAPTISEWAATVRGASLSAGLSPDVALSAEPGRAIVATAGLTCYRVGTIKEIPGIRTYLAVDGGMSDNPRPVLYGSGYEVFLPRTAGAARPFAARVVGKHCESGDVIVADGRLPRDVAVGDVLATAVTGAYGFSMASNYNRVGRPPVLFVSGGSARLVVRRETIDDLLRLEPD